MRLIDADALKEKAWDADTRCGYVQVVDVGDIDNTPTIDIVKHARWIPNVGGFSCSNCKYQTDDDEIGNWDITFGKWVYCPHCGARMDEVSDETD